MKGNLWEGLSITGVIVFVVLLMILSPLVGIWSVNTLFNLNVEYSLVNWIAWCALVITINTGSK